MLGHHCCSWQILRPEIGTLQRGRSGSESLFIEVETVRAELPHAWGFERAFGF